MVHSYDLQLAFSSELLKRAGCHHKTPRLHGTFDMTSVKCCEDQTLFDLGLPKKACDILTRTGRAAGSKSCVGPVGCTFLQDEPMQVQT